MREIVLYDPARHPPEWTDIVQVGQYAVFHSDVNTDIEKKSDGHFLGQDDASTCLLFDSLPEAEAYCATKVEQIPNLRCDIYDHAGKSKPPVLTYVNKSLVNAPKKHAYWGWALVAASLPWFWAEWHWNGTLVYPLIIGLNLVFAGLRLVYWGVAGSEKRRSGKT